MEASPFDEAYFHERQVNGKYEKIYCPKLNDVVNIVLYVKQEKLY